MHILVWISFVRSSTRAETNQRKQNIFKVNAIVYVECVREGPDHAPSARSHYACNHASVNMECQVLFWRNVVKRRKKMNVIITNSISDQFVTITSHVCMYAVCQLERYILINYKYTHNMLYCILLFVVSLVYADCGIWLMVFRLVSFQYQSLMNVDAFGYYTRWTISIWLWARL